jgi:hypothetical protein
VTGTQSSVVIDVCKWESQSLDRRRRGTLHICPSVASHTRSDPPRPPRREGGGSTMQKVGFRFGLVACPTPTPAPALAPAMAPIESQEAQVAHTHRALAGVVG